MTPHPTRALALFAALALLTVSGSFAIADGTPDPGFGASGTFRWNWPSSYALQAHELRTGPDDVVTVAGSVQTGGGVASETLACTWSAVAADSWCATPPVDLDGNRTDEAWGLTYLPTGGIVLAGYDEGPNADPDDRATFTALHANGDLDTSFSGNGVQTVNFAGWAVAYAISARRNGDLLFSGAYDHDAGSPGTGSDCFAGRMAADGTLDTSYSGNGLVTIGWDLGPESRDECTAQALYHDGRLVVAGQVQRADDTWSFGVARLTTAGVLDSTFSGNGKRLIDFPLGNGSSAQATAVAVDRKGRIVVAGRALDGNGWLGAVARLLPDGTLDTSFGPFGNGTTTFAVTGVSPDVLTVEGMRLLPPPSNDIVVVGARTDGSHETGYVAMLRENGVADDTFGSGGRVLVDIDADFDNAVHGVTVAGGKIVVDSTYSSRLNLSTPTNVIALTRLYRNQIFGDDFEGGNTFLWSNRADP